MRLRYLELCNFRNLVSQRIDFDKPTTFVIGKNGQGKTSLLEAIFVLSQAKSFRNSNPRELVCWDTSDCAVMGLVESRDGTRKIRFEVSNAKRHVFVNDKRIAKASHFYGNLAAVVFTPDELQLVKGAPAVRRKFIDRTMAMRDSAYTESLIRYQRALKNRNALLSGARRKTEGLESIRYKIKPWDEGLIEDGLLIAKKRCEFVQELNERVTRLYDSVARESGTQSKLERLECAYQSHFIKERQFLSVEDCQRMYKNSLEREFAYGRTIIGPQRDDVSILLDTGLGQKSARKIASQGQARSIALALMFACVELLEESTGEPPLLLLDDVESELDRARKEALYKLLKSFRSQVFITSTEVSESVTSELGDVAIVEISEGRVN